MLENLGEHIVNGAEFLEHIDWIEFVHLKWVSSDFASLDNVHHPGKHLLNELKLHGAPVRFHTQE